MKFQCVCDKSFSGSFCDVPSDPQPSEFLVSWLIGGSVGGLIIFSLSYMYFVSRRRGSRAEVSRRAMAAELQSSQDMTTALEGTVASLRKAWAISWTELRFESEIGRGSYGVVSTARWRDLRVAVKLATLQLLKALSEEVVRQFENEMSLLQVL